MVIAVVAFILTVGDYVGNGGGHVVVKVQIIMVVILKEVKLPSQVLLMI